jgi:hypothetical protein
LMPRAPLPIDESRDVEDIHNPVGIHSTHGQQNPHHHYPDPHYTGHQNPIDSLEETPPDRLKTRQELLDSLLKTTSVGGILHLDSHVPPSYVSPLRSSQDTPASPPSPCSPSCLYKTSNTYPFLTALCCFNYATSVWVSHLPMGVECLNRLSRKAMAEMQPRRLQGSCGSFQ